MTIKHKILLGYIKDLSVETPDPESLIAARENISKYSLKLDLSSKILKNKMIEVYTRLTYEDKINKKKVYFFHFINNSNSVFVSRCFHDRANRSTELK